MQTKSNITTAFNFNAGAKVSLDIIINIFQPLNTCTLIELTKILFKISLDMQGKSKVGIKQT